MPPKSDKEILKQLELEFLAECFIHFKEAPVVDFAGLATDTNMSMGGAANKYRGILKKLDQERAARKEDSQAPVQAKGKAPAKKHMDVLADEDDDDGLGTLLEEPVKKKRKTAVVSKKAIVLAIGKGRGRPKTVTKMENTEQADTADEADHGKADASLIDQAMADYQGADNVMNEEQD